MLEEFIYWLYVVDFFLLIITFLVVLWVFWYSVMRWWWILVFWCGLLFYGRWAMFSVSIHESFQYTRGLFEAGNIEEPNNYYFFFDQIKNVIIALIVWWLTALIPWKLIKKLKYVIFLGSFVLVLLLMTSLWQDYGKWATLRLEIAGTTIQPGEFLKLWFVFLLWTWMVKKRKILDEFQLYIWFGVICFLSLFVFLLLPDFGSLLVLWPVALLLFWYVGGRVYYILATILLSLFVMVFAYSQYTYVQERVDFFLNSDVDENSRGIWRQTNHALIAVGGWWIFGKWYGKWLQKLWYIPEAQSDFIFAAFSEEVWLLGNIVLLWLYFWLCIVVIRKVWKLNDPTDRVLMVWFLSLIVMQALVNIWVNIKLLPLTWITLPFVSHGWSALMVNVIEIILLWKVLEYKK